MSGIVLSSAVRSNLITLQQTADGQPCPTVLPAGYLNFTRPAPAGEDGAPQECQGGSGYNSWYGSGEAWTYPAAEWRVRLEAAGDLQLADRWILSRLDSLTQEVRASFDGYDAMRATRAIEAFVRDLALGRRYRLVNILAISFVVLGAITRSLIPVSYGDLGQSLGPALGGMAIMTGVAYATSAEMASELGPFPGYEPNAEDMLRVVRNHRRAAHGEAQGYEGLAVNPVDTRHCETATVKDAFGNPTPGVTVRFSVFTTRVSTFWIVMVMGSKKCSTQSSTR